MTKNLHPSLQEKMQQLEEWFAGREGSIVAFSGGIDSSLVLFLSRRFQGKDKAVGVISNSESLKDKDFKLAQEFCRQFDIQLEIIKTGEFDDERYLKNPENRCFFCKEHLFRNLQSVRTKYPGFEILSGTNRDDLGDYRPGLQAAALYRVASPMAECNLTKEDIRQIARHFGLPNWDKPASPCLSSRVPYNQQITIEKLRQIETAENILNHFGFKNVRVRHYGNVGKIEVPKDEMPKLLQIESEVMKSMQIAGFSSLVIDREGLVSGKLNRGLGKNKSTGT